MSDTVSAPPGQIATATVEATPMRSLPESMRSQSFVYAMCMLPVGAGVLVGAFMYLSTDVVATLAGVALAKLLSPSDFFFGGSKHPSAPEPIPGTTTTVTTAPPPTQGPTP